jgi:hypothetical protein
MQEKSPCGKPDGHQRLEGEPVSRETGLGHPPVQGCYRGRLRRGVSGVTPSNAGLNGTWMKDLGKHSFPARASMEGLKE